MNMPGICPLAWIWLFHCRRPGLLRSEIEWKFVGMDLLVTSIKGRPAPTLWIVNALAASVMALQRQGARLYMQRLICFFRSVCKLISQWICSQNQPICQPALLSNAIRCRLKSRCLCMCIVGFFFLRITLMSGLLLLATERALLMSPKGRNASRDGLV